MSDALMEDDGVVRSGEATDNACRGSSRDDAGGVAGLPVELEQETAALAQEPYVLACSPHSCREFLSAPQ